MIPESIRSKISLTSGNLIKDKILLTITSDDNVNFIINAIMQRLPTDTRGLMYDAKQILTKDYVRDVIWKQTKSYYLDPNMTHIQIINKTNTFVVDMLANLLSEEDPHWNPDLEEYEYADWGFDISSIKNGWRPQDLIYNNTPNRKIPYWKQYSAEVIYPGSNTYDFIGLKVGDKKMDVTKQNVSDFRYWNKGYEFTRSKYYPPWNHLSYDHKDIRSPEGLRECGNADRRKVYRPVHHVPDLSANRWNYYNYSPPDKYFLPYFTT